MSLTNATRQISVDRLFADNQARLGMSWLAGRQGGTSARGQHRSKQ